MPHSNDNTTVLLLSLVIIFPFIHVASSETQFPCFFIFGDSLVDNGNNNDLETTAKVDYLPYGIDFPAGPTGRFNNGRNLVDFIAERLGFDKPIPPFLTATDDDILGGVNYASGGAGILDESGVIFGDVITLNEQLRNHEVAISRLATLLGSKKEAKRRLNSCLYYVGMGNNDYLGNYMPQYYDSTTHYTPEQFASVLIRQFSKQLRWLYKNGARKVAVLGLGQIGCIPQQIVTYGNSTGCAAATNDAVVFFNDKLKLLLDKLNFLLPGARFHYVSDNPSYGNITEVGTPCCEVSAERLGHCVVGGAACTNRDEYYFWDWYHPTEAATLLSADTVYDSMAPLFAPLGLDVS
ncbi:hypothetical protein OROMI_016116 [Orobanche minor]